MSAAKYEELARPSAFKAGADRERRRIRMALRNLLQRMESTGAPTVMQYANEIRSATRAKKGKRK